MSTPTPANRSGLTNSGVPAKLPGVEIAASDWDSATAFASPKSIIFAIELSPFNFTIMLLGLMSR
jgi:hypothetical protein